ncbi:hypothetical protein [Microbacterium testaceum]|uniref:hypothetical protein n=1 Tax=Microbacterium testaceum TaxID=2033 RepID=UPI001D171383|nr:hypothetical protein [Microbacterium testaceum]MCC4250730.1 hypothetical protein [Microbacterium testaceum]MCC4250749.1 hypothetical protein [Microbacterium testaceum]
MPTEIASAVPTVLVALIAAVAGIVVAILNRRGNRENALMDQLQEEVKSAREQLGTVEKRVDESLRRERIRDDYIHELRDHIDQRKPPPPPPWPEGLTR